MRGYRRLTRPASAAFTSYLLGPPPLRSFSAAPIRPAIPCPFQKPILDEIAAQGDIIVKNIPQDSIDLFFPYRCVRVRTVPRFLSGRPPCVFPWRKRPAASEAPGFRTRPRGIFSRSLSVTSKRSSRIRTGGAGRVPLFLRGSPADRHFIKRQIKGGPASPVRERRASDAAR